MYFRWFHMVAGDTVYHGEPTKLSLVSKSITGVDEWYM